MDLTEPDPQPLPVRGSGSLLDSPGPDAGMARMPAENAQQRWMGSRRNRAPQDVSPGGAPFGIPGLSQARAYGALTGRIDASAPHSPSDSTPSAMQPQPSFGQGPTDSNTWGNMFQAGMDEPIKAIRPRSGYSWENKDLRRPFTGTEPTSRFDAAVAAGGALQSRPEFTAADAERQLDVTMYNRGDTNLRKRIGAYRGWTPY